ncbi:Trm112 family protein [Archangium lipolyticum]|uniref:Trm112 family protein n=1 Tax=Archangium lipolyticum TaxID=2970465 RepID=UPI00389915AA
MRLPDELLATLACPSCKGALVFQSRGKPPLPLGEGWGEGLRASTPGSEDELHCEHCRLAYPIRDSVPELLNASARRY